MQSFGTEISARFCADVFMQILLHGVVQSFGARPGRLQGSLQRLVLRNLQGLVQRIVLGMVHDFGAQIIARFGANNSPRYNATFHVEFWC